MFNMNLEPRPAARYSLWLYAGLLGTLILFLLTGMAQVQAEALAPSSYALGQQIYPVDPVTLNDEIYFTIYITNTGTTDITSLPLTDTFDSNYLTFVWAYPMPDSDNGAGQLKWNDIVANCAGSLAPQSACTIQVYFKAKQDTTLLPDQRTINTVQSGSQQSSAGVRIDAALVRYTVEQQASSYFVTPGTAISFTVSIHNTGGAIITSLPLTDTFDAQDMLFISAIPPVDANNAGQLKWNNFLANCGGTLAPQATCRGVVNFVTLQNLGNTYNSVESGSQQSSEGVSIVTPTQPPNPFEDRPVWNDSAAAGATSLAWGDVDADGDLDLAVSYIGSDYSSRPLRVYLSQAGRLQTDPAWQSGDSNTVGELAWGDVDGDGDLDLVVGNYNATFDPASNAGQDKIYLNQNGQLATTPAWTSTDNDYTTSIALGDVDGDGDLDLAVGNPYGENKIYLFAFDAQGQLTATLGWHAGVNYLTGDIGLADADGDGDLDLAVGVGLPNAYPVANPQPLRIYLFTKNAQNNLTVQQEITLGTVENITSLAWGDVDADGDLDLAVGVGGGGLKLYLNQTTNQQVALSLAWTSDATSLSALAWGDINNDGRLDLIVLSSGDDLTITPPSPKFYLNQPDPNTNMRWKFLNTGITFGEPSSNQASPALGDLDADGDLDLALIKNGKATVMVNRGGSLQLQNIGPAMMSAPIVDIPSATAWGDVDGDGDLDLATIGITQDSVSSQARLYLNQNGQLPDLPVWVDLVSSAPRSLAWGDMDGDGDLDLAIGSALDLLFGNAGQELVYLNQNGQLATTPAWTSTEADNTRSLAWGDVDADGDLDLAVGNAGQEVIYLNEQGQLTTTPAWRSTDLDDTWSVAWGDVDGDGDLDLATGNVGAPNKLYRNVGPDAQGKPRLTEDWRAAVADNTLSVAWGDVDGDGDLDLAAGNWGGPETIYLNAGGRLSPVPAWRSADVDDTWAVAWGDADGDGDLDLATANAQRPIRIYLNQDGILQTAVERIWQLASFCSPSSLAWGDLDRDGDLDLAFTNGASCSPQLFLNPKFAPLQRSGQHPESIVVQPTSSPVQTFSGQSNMALAPANFYATAGIRSAGVIPISYSLFSPTGAPMQQVRAFYSPDGGGHWLPAVATSATITKNLATGPYPTPTAANTHVFNWDVIGSGFFGQSDNMVVRIEAILSVKAGPNSVAGPYQRSLVAAQTFPFRVRGTQVRVVHQAALADTFAPAVDALLYRLPAGQNGIAQPIRAGADSTPYRTDIQGYLQGRGQLTIGDQLVALAPITASASYTLYHMSAAPTLAGLAAHSVLNRGVQTLTVTAENPLLLFNLKVALEWDARQDRAFLDQLEFDLRRTAEILFDATDGQATLGAITIYHNKEYWGDADIRIYASNALIPNADPGGIVRSEQSEIITANPFSNATTPYSLTYQPGHIRIGAVWNRFGEASGALGEDWPRTLAHELGHYAFYLYDNYLGLQDGTVVPVATCTGTLMSDQYREDFSEFRTVDTWATDCAQTISAQRSGRSDWETITRFYPWLQAPSAATLNNGPATLPLAVTQVQRAFSPSEPMPLEIALFDLVDANGKAQSAGEHAQAVLYSQGRLIDLGHPVGDKLAARGAHVGDRLCVYDLPAQRLGCETVTNNDTFLTLVKKTDWVPTLTVSPASSTTVGVLVSGVGAGLNLRGKLYPENGIATTDLPLLATVDGGYTVTFVLASGALAGHIQVWVDEADSPSNPRRETTTSYALGGSPGKRKTSCSPRCISAAGVGATVSDQVAPAIAPDGQVLIYGNVRFDDGEFYALQKVNQLPTAPLWTTIVGDGYRILKSDGAPDLVNTSILFRYRGQDVPAGEEKFLTLYFWDEANPHWQRLPTVLNPAVNEASALARGPGLYVLMSSLEIPIRQTGWNLIAYPVQETRPVTQALASLGNGYTLVYGYVITDTVDPWKVYDPAAPAYVNDLQTLAFGQGYWINASQVITWLLKGSSTDQVQTAGLTSVPTPPATFYGDVLVGQGLNPAAGLPVQGLINGVVCGTGETQEVDGMIVYSLNVEGDGVRNPACLGAGQQVVITVAGLPQQVVPWQNDRVQQIILNAQTLFLPIIWR